MVVWNLNVLCAIPAIFDNYRGSSLLNIAYRVPLSILCERLSPTMNQQLTYVALDMENLQLTRYSQHSKPCERHMKVELTHTIFLISKPPLVEFGINSVSNEVSDRVTSVV